MTYARAIAPLFAAALTLTASAASAQTYPNRPITFVVPSRRAEQPMRSRASSTTA